VLISENVVHETIDGETVVINLTTGAYFSLEGAAAVTWERLIRGDAPERVAGELAAETGAAEPAVARAVISLHQDLYAAGLLQTAPAAAPPPADEVFHMPSLQRYDDMREHLLVDPIHAVERGIGWPAPPAA
jgi:hypothetical protein